MTKIVNIYKEKYDVYIGRAGKGKDGYFGNPHSVGYCSLCRKYHLRDECLSLYKEYFLKRIEEDQDFKKEIMELNGKTLGCFCKPSFCHGDIIVDWLESNIKEENNDCK